MKSTLFLASVCFLACNPNEESGAGGGPAEGEPGVTTTHPSEAPDATVTTGTPVAVPPPVVVHLIDGASGLPAADVLVFTTDEAGRLVDKVWSEADGTATLEMPDAGGVHVARKRTISSETGAHSVRVLLSQLDVPMGQELSIRVAPPSGSELSPPLPQPMAVTVRASGAQDGDVWAALSCAGQGLVAEGGAHWDAYTGCPAQGSYSVFVVAFDGDGRLERAGARFGLPFVAGGAADHDLPLATSHVVTSSFTVTAPQGDGWHLTASLSGTRDGHQQSWSVSKDDARTATFDERVPDFFDRYEWRVEATSGSEGPERTSYVRGGVSGVPPTAMEVSAAAVARVRVGRGVHESPNRIGYEITLDDGPRGDVVGATLGWTHDDDGAVFWSAYAPPVASSQLVTPELPLEIADWSVDRGHDVGKLEVFHQDTDVTTSPIDFTARDVRANAYATSFGWGP